MREQLREHLLDELNRREAKDSFWKFCLYMDKDFFTTREDVLREYIEEYNDIAHGEFNGEDYALNVAMPRRTGKSYVVNLWIIWLLARDNNVLILRATYNADKAKDMHNEVRALMVKDRYHQVFPDVEIDVDNTDEIRMKGSTRVNFKTVSVGGAATGGGANYIIADDLYKNEMEAMSEATNKRIKSWYYSAFKSSLEGDKRVEIVVGTRWRVGEITDDIKFDKRIVIRALTDNNESFCEDVITTKSLLDIKEAMHESLFMAMYQQEPMIAKGALMKHSDFIPMTEQELSELHSTGRIIYTMALVDNKTTGKDFYAVPIIAITQDYRMILEDVVYTQEVISDKLEARTARVLNAVRTDLTYFETNKDYSHFRNMKKLLTGSAIAFNTHENKEAKILTNAYRLKGIYTIETQDPEYNGFINDICRYDIEGTNKTDDAIDSLVMLVQRVQQKYRRAGN